MDLDDLTCLLITYGSCLFHSIFYPALRLLVQFEILVDLFCVGGDFCEQHKFVFWYTRRTPGVRNQTSYEDNIKKIVEFSTVRSLKA